MKVGELKKAIEGLSDDTEVLLQKDCEGNGYSPLEWVDKDVVVERDEYEYVVYHPEWSADDCCLEEDVWRDLKKTEGQFIVLAP